MNVDHTWVREAVDAGALTSEQARAHPHANIIRRYLGSDVDPEVDVRLRTDRANEYSIDNQGFYLRSGDRLLLCTDGLNDMVVDSEIAKLLAEPDIHKASADLVAAANQAGGKDNITVVILEVPKKQGVAGFWANLREINPQLAVAYAGLVLMGLAVLSALVMVLFQLFTK